MFIFLFQTNPTRVSKLGYQTNKCNIKTITIKNKEIKQITGVLFSHIVTISFDPAFFSPNNSSEVQQIQVNFKDSPVQPYPPILGKNWATTRSGVRECTLVIQF